MQRLKKTKEIFRMKNTFQIGKGLNYLSKNLIFGTFNNHVYITTGVDFKINFFNSEGEEVFSINQDYKRIKFSKKDERNSRENLRLKSNQIYKMIKNQINFPEYFSIYTVNKKVK